MTKQVAARRQSNKACHVSSLAKRPLALLVHTYHRIFALIWSCHLLLQQQGVSCSIYLSGLKKHFLLLSFALFAPAENAHTASPCFTCDFADMMCALERDLGLHCSHNEGNESSTVVTLLPLCGQYGEVHLQKSSWCDGGLVIWVEGIPWVTVILWVVNYNSSVICGECGGM